MRYHLMIPVLAVLCAAAVTSQSQDGGPSWRRTANPELAPLELFRSNQALNLPTAAMLSGETFEFEVAHRFLPAIRDGHEVLFGLDGPATVRIALAYGVSDNLTVILGRSNLDDNLDLSLKARVLEVRNSSLPVALALVGGLGWNTQVFGLADTDSRSFQYYTRVIINAMIAKKLGLGVVPSYLYNTDVRSEKAEDIMRLGFVVQYYVSPVLSLLAEWDPALSGDDSLEDPLSCGIEIKAGGHFFKILASNSTRLNPSQYIAGSDDPAGGNYWHLGFTITRLLKFW